MTGLPQVGTPKLQQTAANAGSAFLEDSAALWQMAAFVEIEKLDQARKFGSAAAEHFDRASKTFPQAANLVEKEKVVSEQLTRVFSEKSELRKKGTEAAGKLASVSPSASTVTELTELAGKGSANQLLLFPC